MMSVGVTAEGGGQTPTLVGRWISPHGAECELHRTRLCYHMCRRTRAGRLIVTHVSFTGDTLATFERGMKELGWVER